MSIPVIPQAIEAEQVLVGAAVLSSSAAGAILARLNADAVYDRRNYRALQAGAALPPGGDLNDRARAISETTGLPCAELVRWAEDCPTRRDPTGRYLGAVHSAAIRRQTMHLAAKLYTGAASAELSELQALLSAASEALVAA